MSRLPCPLAICLLAAFVPRAHAAPVDLPKLLATLGERADRLEARQRSSRYLERSQFEVLDDDGEIESKGESSTRVSWKDGRPQRELLSFVENGKDVTKEKREEQAKKKHEPLAGPLTTKEQPRYRFSVVDAPPDAQGRIRIRFEPRGDREKASVGELLVDPAAASVVQMRLSPAELPTLADRVDVTVELGVETPDGRLPSRVTVEAEGGLPLFKKRYLIRTRISDYVFAE